MSDEHPLSEKAGRWNDRPKNAATPVFDPGLAPLGSDEEAGGARRPDAGGGDASGMPKQTTPEAGGIGVRLTPKVWYTLAAIVALIVIVAAVASFA